MTPFAQAVRELGDEMEARAIKALAMALVQPEAAEKWTAQAMAATAAWGKFRFIGNNVAAVEDFERGFQSAFAEDHAQQIAALVERFRQDAKEPT